MASGYGINGGTSRCFPFWQAVVKCYSETDNPGKCTLHKEDYNECLHHSKAKARQARIKSEFARIRADGVADLRRQSEIYKAMGRAGGVSVGLIEHIIAKSSTTKHQGVGGQQDVDLLEVQMGKRFLPEDSSEGILRREGDRPVVRVDWEVPKKAA